MTGTLHQLFPVRDESPIEFALPADPTMRASIARTMRVCFVVDAESKPGVLRVLAPTRRTDDDLLASATTQFEFACGFAEDDLAAMLSITPDQRAEARSISSREQISLTTSVAIVTGERMLEEVHLALDEIDS